MDRLVSSACLSLLLAAAGCADRAIDVPVQQPLDFPHQTHLVYFSSGLHRTEKIRMHLDMFGEQTPPAELAEGRCVECHDDLAERTACASCHVPFQNAALRSQRDIRPCVACHRGAWGASAATIPSAATCLSCHEAGVRLARAGNTKPRMILARAGDARGERPIEDVPWVRINTMPANVYFSHSAHVRFAAMPCSACHEDVRALTAPPTSVRTLSMSECVGCHMDRGASTDCLTCHK